MSSEASATGDPSGRKTLHYAALSGDSAAVRQEISSGADMDAGDVDGFTPLHLAVQDWQVEAASALLEAGAEVDRPNVYGNTPLFVAVFNSRGHGEMIDLLRRNGADPLRVNHSGQSPLGLARLIGNYDVAQYFSDLE